MNRTFLAFALCCACASVLAQAPGDFDAGVYAYANGDFKTARERLMKVEYKNDKASRFADFLLSAIAANEGDEELARERFDRAFKNLPEGNELNLAKNFAAFCDINGFYKYEAETLKPFYKSHADLVMSDSMLAWQFAKALMEAGDGALAKDILLGLFDKYAADASAAGVDKILFDGRACEILKGSIGDYPEGIGQARAKIIKGETDDLRLPENATVGLALKFLQLKKPVSEEQLNAALESDENSEFAWEAWYALAASMFEEGRYEIAYAEAMRAQTLAPDSLEDTWKIAILMGDCLRFQKKFGEAREEYSKIALQRKMQGEPAAEAIYKCGLAYFEEGKWAEAYDCFQRVFVAYFGFEKWSSLAYYYGAKAQLELKNPVGARNVLREYLKHAKHKDTPMYHKNAALWSNIKLN